MSFDFVIDERVERAVRCGARVALNLSGGKDSTMSVHAACQILDRLGHPRSFRLLVHADLGRAEWQSTAAVVKRQAAQLGLPLVTVRRQVGDLVQRWEQRYELGLELYAGLQLARMRSPWSSASLRFCTSEMKVQPINRYLAATFPGETIISVLGIRHAESAARAKTPISAENRRLHRANGTRGIIWHPSLHISTDQVFEYHRLHSLHLHEGYTTHGVSRISCAACVIAGLRDLQIASHVPSNHELFRHLIAMEIRTGFSFQPARWLADAAPHLLQPDFCHRLDAAKAYADERRAIESQISTQLIKGISGKSWPGYMPCLDDVRAIAEARRLNAAWTGRNLPFTTIAAVNEQYRRMLSH